MIIPVASIGYNRPEMQELSLEYLSKCLEAKQTPLHLFVDHGMSEEQANILGDKFAGKFASVDVHYAEKKKGLSRSIAGAMRYMMREYPVCCILEDDVLCSKDFLRLHSYIQENIDLDMVLTVSGYAKNRVDPSCSSKLDELLNKRTWYSPDGVVINRAGWEVVGHHFCEEYFSDPRGYLDKFYEVCKQRQPRFAERCWPDGKRRWTEQAGLINTVRASLGMYVIAPEMSRCQDIGVYGKNRHQKVSGGEDIHDEALWKTCNWYSTCFAKDHTWDVLRIGNVEEV